MPENDIELLNKKHFVAQEGGKTRVYNESFDTIMQRSIITSSTFDDFRNFYFNQYIEIESIIKGKPGMKYERLGQHWLASTSRRQYEQIVFEPGKKLGADFYNLWKGFSVEENENGDWGLLSAHIRDNVCCGNMEYYNYYLDWWANAIQHPDQQANVALVLKGKRGGGKGSAIGYFAELFGQHHIHVFSSRQVTGNFNYHLRDAVILFSDEAIYAGNHAEESVLKGLITEKYIPIEGKYRDLMMVRNNLHVAISTNHEWAVPAGLDERRFFVLNMKDDETVKQNTFYFNSIKRQMDNGGRGRLLHDMLQRDISGFDTYKAPNTFGLLEQKMMSMDGHHAWWHNCLQQGHIVEGVEWEEWIPFAVIYEDYNNYCNKLQQRWGKKDPVRLGEFLSLMTDKFEIFRSKRNIDGYYIEAGLLKTKAKRFIHYKLPSIQHCRAAFEKISVQTIKWPPILKLVDDDPL